MIAARWFWLYLTFVSGIILMTSSKSASGQTADPLRGPDFVLQKVASWTERSAADSELVLQDGSAWRLKPGTKIYEAQRDMITRTKQRDAELFVSGDKTRGFVEFLVSTQALAVQEIGGIEPSGRYSVVFYGPPSIYHVRADRPWASQALSLLRQSSKSGAFFDTPDLVVAIDPTTSEIMAVKPLQTLKPGASR
jgi:hypothetical protein